jgi:hypothetical protein
MELETHRFALPQLVVAQAHKEITHNEALVLVDALLHPLVEGVATSPPTLSINDAGKCWLVDNSSSDSFAGKEGHLAYWTGGSWRFTVPVLGMRVWHRPGGYLINYADEGWVSFATVELPSGGAVVDAECRAALGELISRLSDAGILHTT